MSDVNSDAEVGATDLPDSNGGDGGDVNVNVETSGAEGTAESSPAEKHGLDPNRGDTGASAGGLEPEPPQQPAPDSQPDGGE